MEIKYGKNQGAHSKRRLIAKAAYLLRPLVATALVMGVAGAANAQDANTCRRNELKNPARVVYRCAGGLLIEAEAQAMLGIGQNAGERRPLTVNVAKGAVLINLTPGGGAFQISTPHAIAAVRGTIYAVDASKDKTSVFVLRGHVAVSSQNGSGTVELLAGEGTDVLADDLPTAAKKWAKPRVDALFARFGR